MICKLTPACKDYIWGGTKLKTDFGKTSGGAVLAETWELSCHPDGPSTLATGAYAGQTLPEYFAEHPAAAGTACAEFDHFPVLVKLIDAQKPLSVQVHPDDAYAQEHEGQYGKTEMWYVVAAEKDAFLYYGFTHTITPEEFSRRIEEGTLCEVLQAVPVKAGDCLFIEAGTVHAIGAGIVIAEIQQSSNVTYRVYDYGRTDAQGNTRALHIAQAKAVSVLGPARVRQDFGGHLGACRYFTVDEWNLCGEHTQVAGAASFHAVLILEGEGTLQCGEETLPFTKGDMLLITAQSGAYCLCGTAKALCVTVGDA